jgi:hypothetical protein
MHSQHPYDLNVTDPKRDLLIKSSITNLIAVERRRTQQSTAE